MGQNFVFLVLRARFRNLATLFDWTGRTCTPITFNIFKDSRLDSLKCFAMKKRGVFNFNTNSKHNLCQDERIAIPELIYVISKKKYFIELKAHLHT